MGKFDIVYISSACNRTPHSADWGRNNLICYATSNSIALYDPEYSGAGKVLSVLCQHKDRINSVRWIKDQNGMPETELISASTDGTAIIWTKTDGHSFFPTSVLKGHQNAVMVADGIYVSNSENFSNKQQLIVATASVDSTVKLWRRFKDEEDTTCVQTLSFGSGFCLSLSFAYLPGIDVALLACAGDDAKIHLFAENTRPSDTNSDEQQFIRVNTLVGHEDWIRAMDFTLDESGNVLLASSSQDSLIRLWRISPRDEEMATRIRKKISELDISEDIQPEENFFSVKISNNNSTRLLHFAVSLESVLTGHEGWVYGVNWHPPVYSNEKKKIIQPMKLLSSSLDKTIIIWEPDEASGVWLESVRLGEVGGNTLGFYGSKFGPDGLRIMGHGYQGSFHLWSYSKNSGIWKPDVTVGGHFGEVMDLQWEPGGQFLLSVSSDQTTRLHAPWLREGHQEVTWHELARPQVHGYDMSCIAILSRYRFASGAEEKVIRAFQAPSNFVNNFHRICQVESDKDFDHDNALTAPQGASVPALGLSNKAVYEGQEMLAEEERHIKDEYPEFYFTPIDLEEPPTEENLLQNTLWPEIYKLYGHGYELFALAARHDGTLLASTCKATTSEHASIILWDTSTWKQTQKLTSHTLTVTQMSFSPDDRFLLSVSRDRRWSLFQLQDEDTGHKKYSLVATTEKKTGVHTRIIWCCSWTHDSKYFVTGSRDGKVIAWSHSGKQESHSSLSQCSTCSKPLELANQSVTALAVAPMLVAPETYLVAVGLESGDIILYKWSPCNEEAWQKCLELGVGFAHHLTVKRVAFRPLLKDKQENPVTLDLATCGCDHAVKIFRIYLNEL